MLRDRAGMSSDMPARGPHIIGRPAVIDDDRQHGGGDDGDEAGAFSAFEAFVALGAGKVSAAVLLDERAGSREVVDLALNPELGAADRILALPTLVRKLPVPIRKIIGDFTNPERLRIALNLPAERIAA